MRSLIGVLLVAGVVALSLVVADEVQAEPVVSSYYGPGFEGALTASGETFDPYAHTAAHPYLPMGTELEVCYQGCVVVTVNDRGPYAGDRSLDVSLGAAEAIGLTPAGVDVVDARVTGSSLYREPSDKGADASTADSSG